MIISMKIVPADNPNAKGKWIKRRIPMNCFQSFGPLKLPTMNWDRLDKHAPKGYRAVMYSLPNRRRIIKALNAKVARMGFGPVFFSTDEKVEP